MNILPLDLSRLITSQLDDDTLFSLSSVLDLTLYTQDQSWWFLRVRHLLDSRGHSDKSLTFREGSWQRAYYILLPVIGAECPSPHPCNDYDNEIAASCLLDLGWKVQLSTLSHVAGRGSINLFNLFLPLSDPNREEVGVQHLLGQPSTEIVGT